MSSADVLACVRCKRLSRHLSRQRRIYPDYHNQPVPGCGDNSARLLIVGLAPGLHGANATGFPFTGDSSGDMIYRQLRLNDFLPGGTQSNNLTGLNDCRITNAVKCLPPDNLPTANEVSNCNRFLRTELNHVPENGVVLALGRIAHKAVLKAFRLTLAHYPFAHLAEHAIPGGRILLDSYHCSRYNLNTGRLTEADFQAVFVRIRHLFS